MHNAFLLFRRQKANMDKNDLPPIPRTGKKTKLRPNGYVKRHHPRRETGEFPRFRETTAIFWKATDRGGEGHAALSHRRSLDTSGLAFILRAIYFQSDWPVTQTCTLGARGLINACTHAHMLCEVRA